MITAIKKNHPVFASAAYRKDRVPFSVLEGIREAPTLLAGDGGHVVIGTSSPDYPAWVWTAEGVPMDAARNLCEYCYQAFGGKEWARFVAKPPIAALLEKRFAGGGFETLQMISMESFECPHPLPAKNQEVEIGRPEEGDAEELADMLRRFDLECFGQERHEDYLGMAYAFIEGGRTYLIREGGKPAAMAKAAFETKTHIAVNSVYTRPASRGRGYAAALAAHIAGEIVKQGKIPCLYTDLANPRSNKAYRNVGFVERGKVCELTLRRRRPKEPAPEDKQ